MAYTVSIYILHMCEVGRHGATIFLFKALLLLSLAKGHTSWSPSSQISVRISKPRNLKPFKLVLEAALSKGGTSHRRQSSLYSFDSSISLLMSQLISCMLWDLKTRLVSLRILTTD